MGRGEGVVEDMAEGALRSPLPQRALVAGDFHMDLTHVREVIAAATTLACEVILQVGDFGFWPYSDPDFLPELDQMLQDADGDRAKQGLGPLFLVWLDGNHEHFDALEAGTWPQGADGFRMMGKRIFYSPRGNRFTWNGTRFLTLGGGYSLDKASRKAHLDWFPQETISQRDVYQASSGGPVDVLLSHDCPQGAEERMGISLSKGAREDEVNRMAVRAVCDATHPKLLIHGHYHHRYETLLEGDGYRTRVIGLDMNGSGERSWIVLDLSQVA